MDVYFIINDISSILNNCWFTTYHFHIEWWIQHSTERNTTVWIQTVYPFSQLLYLSFHAKMTISKSTIIIIKYWINIVNYKIYILSYLLKLPACGSQGPKNNTNRCWIWNTTLPYKFGSPLSFVRITAGFPQINLFMKPTLCIILQAKFQYSNTLKCIAHRLPYY